MDDALVTHSKTKDARDRLLAKKKRELKELHRRSFEDAEGYWSDAAQKLIWIKKWDQVRDLSDAPITKWFVGGQINACYNCLDRHIEDGNGDVDILYFDSPVTGTRTIYTYNQIQDEVIRLAGLLDESGVRKGDLVMIYMPMIVEGIFAMLASCRIGAVHTCMPSGLPAQDLAVRIDHAKPKVILVGSAGYEAHGWVDYKVIFEEAYRKSTHKPKSVLVWRRTDIFNVTMVEGRDIDWKEAAKKAKPKLECVPTEANEPFLVIYTSGSTGEPKGIVHSINLIVKFQHDISLILGGDNEVFFSASNFGWLVSHVQVYGCLLAKKKAVLMEGDTLLSSNPSALYKLIRNNGVTRLLLRPGILKLLRQMDPDGKVASQFDLKSIRQLHYVGENLDKATSEWAVKIFRTILSNGYGQTEGGAFLAGSSDYAIANNSGKVIATQTAFPGIDVVIMKSDNSIANANEVGRILFRLPLPPGSILTLFRNHEKCKDEYFSEYPGYYDTKDNGYLDEEGDLVIDGRADDIMKHASIYLAAQAVEEIVMSHPEVVECVVISTPHLVLKEVPVTLYTPKNNVGNEESKVSVEIMERLSKHFGEAVTFGEVIVVKEFPRTRTGKLHRPSLKALGKGQKVKATGGLENPEVLEDIASALKKAGYGCE